jgi:hypothetical protein
MGTKTFEGVWFISYSHDHYPAHVHGKYGRVQVIVDLLADGNVVKSGRADAVRPMNAKRSDVAHILDVAAAHAGELNQLWERTHGSPS